MILELEEGPMGVRWNVPDADKPFQLTEVAESGAAAKGGLQTGMTLLEVNDQTIEDLRAEGLDRCDSFHCPFIPLTMCSLSDVLSRVLSRVSRVFSHLLSCVRSVMVSLRS